MEFDCVGKTFSFTGRMKAMGRTEAKKLITSMEGNVASVVDRSVNVLVVGDVGGNVYTLFIQRQEKQKNGRKYFALIS